MKKMKCKLLLILSLIFTLTGFGQNGIEKKITKEFPVDVGSEFVIMHKFGDISIENWNENKILIDVSIVADAKNQDKAEKLFNEVEIDFSTKGKSIRVKTSYKSQLVHKDVTVNYKIKMPHYIELDLTNKFGSVFINEISGKSRIAVSYGSLKAEKLLYNDTKPLSRIILSYGSAEITKCSWLQIDTKYSSLEINKAKALVIDSRFSNIEIDECHSIIATSKYDNYENGSANNLVLTAKFTNFEIGNISNKLDLNFEYGGFEAGNVAAGFKLIKIKNKYGEVDLRIDLSASYVLDAHSKYCIIDFSSANSVEHQEYGSENSYKGIVGSDKETKSKVIIESKYGSIDLD
ncbi:MAG: hypothetical protein U9R19_08180 [Bacteroidota bacterium]|nr:hypothetical protein [Bacteroidota bacterium]